MPYIITLPGEIYTRVYSTKMPERPATTDQRRNSIQIWLGESFRTLCLFTEAWVREYLPKCNKWKQLHHYTTPSWKTTLGKLHQSIYLYVTLLIFLQPLKNYVLLVVRREQEAKSQVRASWSSRISFTGNCCLRHALNPCCNSSLISLLWLSVNAICFMMIRAGLVMPAERWYNSNLNVLWAGQKLIYCVNLHCMIFLCNFL